MNMVVIRILWDDEANVWVAICDEIGLSIESDSYDELLDRISVIAPEMANENHVECSSIRVLTNDRQIACA